MRTIRRLVGTVFSFIWAHGFKVVVFAGIGYCLYSQACLSDDLGRERSRRFSLQEQIQEAKNAATAAKEKSREQLGNIADLDTRIQAISHEQEALVIKNRKVSALLVEAAQSLVDNETIIDSRGRPLTGPDGELMH